MPQPPSSLRPSLIVALLLPLLGLGVPWLNDDSLHQLILDDAAGRRAAPGPVFAAQRDALGVLNLFEFMGRATPVSALVESANTPWYTAPGLRISFWRPLSSLLAQADHALGAGVAWVAHLHSGLWYLAAAALVGGLYRRLAPGLAPLAALVWALDEAHALPVLWPANRNAVVAMALGLGALLAHMRWREGGGWRWGAGAALGWAAALGAGEAGLGALATLAAWELFGRAEPLPARLRALLPAVGIGGLWALAYKAQGFGAVGSTLYVDPVEEPAVWLAQAPVKLARLAGAQLLNFSTDLALPAPGVAPVQAAVGLLALGALAALLRGAWPDLDPAERAALRWLGPAALLSALPVLSTWPLDRLLLWPGLGGSLAVAALLRHAWATRRRALGLALALLHLLQPLLMWLVLALGLRFVGGQLPELMRTTLADGRWQGRRVLLLNASDMGLAVYGGMVAERLRLPTPSAYLLGNPAPVGATLSRPDPERLVLRLDEDAFYRGFTPQLVGRQDTGPRAGDCVVQRGVQICVLEEGVWGPRAWSYRVLDPAEPPLALWRWDGAALVEQEPPGVGLEVALPWVPGPLGM